jgi:predicted GIY-YIG superfamily endonuclease
VLAESEKFRNAAGEVCEVEVRGDRSFDKCYFKVKDIGRVFGVKRLDNNITYTKSKYVEGIHYIIVNDLRYLIRNCDGNIRFFTYHGMMTWLYCSHEGATKHYIQWIEKTLFTVQFGSQSERKVLAKKIKNPSYSAFKDMTDKCASTIGGIYLFKIGSVRHLRKAFDLPKYDEDDNHMFHRDNCIYKYGYSKNIERRFKEHKLSFGKLSDKVEVELIYYATIDEEHLRAAENKIVKKFSDYRIVTKGNRELLTLDEDQVEHECKKLYKKIQKKYGKTNVELRTALKESKKVIKNVNSELSKAMLLAGRLELENELLEKKLQKCEDDSDDESEYSFDAYDREYESDDE